MQANPKTNEVPAEVPAKVRADVVEAIRIGSDGAMARVPASPELLEAEVKRRVKATVGQAEQSAAAARLQKLRGGAPAVARIERVDVEGQDEPFWIRRFNLEDLTRVALLSARDRSGRLVLIQEGSLHRLLSALLFVGVANGEHDPTPFFASWEEASDWAGDATEAVVNINGELFARLTALNPSILPGENSQDQEEDAAKDGEEAPLAAPESSTSPPPTRADGSAETPLTGAAS